MKGVARLVLIAATLATLAACDTYNDRYGERGYPTSAVPPGQRATILHQDRPGGSDYNPYQYRRELRGY
jgi:hypothetical protein